MIRKYRIDFRFDSGIQIHPYNKDGVIIEAHTADDALTQARIEIDEIGRRKNMIAGDRWCFTKIIVLSDRNEHAAVEAEREACAKIIQDEINVWKGYTNNELPIRELTGVLNKIRAQSEGEKKGE